MDSFNEEIVHISLGSTPLISVPILLYLYDTYKRLSPQDKQNMYMPFEYICIFLPVFTGIILAAVYRLITSLVPRKINNIYLRFIIAGGITGIITSAIGLHLLHIQDRLLFIRDPEKTHIYMGIAYLVYFYFIMCWLRYQILHGPDPMSGGGGGGGGMSSILPRPPMRMSMPTTLPTT
jgi:nitrate/nitrite transporter NarK